MAYIGHHSQPRAAARAKRPKVPLPPLAWERLLVIAASLLAWAGIIAAARALFF